MKHYTKLLLVSAAFSLMGGSIAAQAETVTTKTVVTQKDLPNIQKTDFSIFDLNHDNVLSMYEVGEKLFYIFDTDGNAIIDNIEFNNKKVVTIIPMEKQTYTFVDRDNDGSAEQMDFSYETFLQKSHLMRFDNDMDGLSPADFIEKTFLELDTDNSKAIEVDEWKKAYIASVLPDVADEDHYN